MHGVELLLEQERSVSRPLRSINLIDDGKVKVGDRVSAGQLIAYVGTTGWSTGPHTHFMTVVNGRAVDPLGLLPP